MKVQADRMKIVVAIKLGRRKKEYSFRDSRNSIWQEGIENRELKNLGEYKIAGIGGEDMDGKKRSEIVAGLEVEIVLKQDQRTGKRTRGIVKDILTNSSTHPHGIKVRLTNGMVGRVQEIIKG